ncbi:MAG: hypothetical protein LBK61_13460 [Spirochaetaceae bacterium]|jgi:hypothetical protein|nr:hypothetical protein [Spirochaetaceae bacterium]
MQKSKTVSGAVRLLLALAAATAILLVGIGCPTETDEGGGPDYNVLPPEKPVLFDREISIEFKDEVVLKNIDDNTANNVANRSAVIAIAWRGEGALSYNVYQTEGDVFAQPGTPTSGGASLTDPVYFARGLKAETDYHFWIEAINPNGRTVSDRIDIATLKLTGKVEGDDDTVERGDYPKNMRVIPGSGSLTVSWDLSDRVGWYEVYYAPKTGAGSIKHLDIYTPLVFKYDANPATTVAGAIDISAAEAAITDPDKKVAYKGNGVAGYTRPLYPFLSPLAPNNGWEGYYVRTGNSRVDGDTRPVLGLSDTTIFPSGTFYKIGEAFDQGIQDPYKKLDAAFAQATPWTGTAAGTAGTPVKFYGTSTTITGLTNGTEYEVWVRSPNANGERGYGYIVGTPGAPTGALAAPASVQAITPVGSTRSLLVYWTGVAGAQSYRIYASKFDYTPNASMRYSEVPATAETTCVVNGLDSDSAYNVWVVAVKDGYAGAFSAPVAGRTGATPASGHTGDKTIDGTGTKVKTAVYIEVNDDNPLNAGSYILEDGTYLFDYVVLFAANIRNRDSNATPKMPYLHLNNNVQKILDNRNKYIKPLQDKGIKVLLGLLGDHDGVGFGTMNAAERTAFITSLKTTVDAYGLDGVDFDDEWASFEDWDHWGDNYTTIAPNSIWTYPVSNWGWPTEVTVYRDKSKGIVAGNGILSPAPSEAEMTTMWKPSGVNYFETIKLARETLGQSKIISLYEYNTGRYITPNGVDNGNAKKNLLEGYIDFALQPWYNQYIDDSINGLSRTKYSPFGMDLSGEAYESQHGAPNPPIAIGGSTTASGTVYDYATRFKQAADDGQPYQMMYFYALEPAGDLLKRVSSDSAANVTKEEYISMMTSIVFGQKTVVTADGGKYTKDW